MATLDSSSRTARRAATVRSALRILKEDLREYGASFCNQNTTRDFLRLQLEREEREVFACLFLTAQNQLIEYNVMFYGTLTQTVVYPREILREALRLNAGSIILAHTHPSGNVNPSEADRKLTRVIDEILAPMDVRVLDHMIVAPGAIFSFAENGLTYPYAKVEAAPVPDLKLEKRKRCAKRITGPQA